MRTIASALRNYRVLGKKTLVPAADLERSIAAALSQFSATKKNCDALIRDLDDAKRALASAEKGLCDVAELKALLRVATEKCEYPFVVRGKNQ